MIKHTFIGIICLLFAGVLMAQTSISGKIIHGETKRPVTGASIQSKNSGIVIQTNTEGNFAVHLMQLPDTLYITHVGFSAAAILVTSASTFYKTELFPDENEMEQVLVNTGYQKIKPNEINGSVTVIDNKLLNQQTGTNILQRLNGVTNGLLFNIGKRGSTSGACPMIFLSAG
ncbi:carboxypeptidase-like regulatory domain-containing protein [Niabella defluvii]|nr:carboxypeptidase-like regulatory domain-containing protein [Niabella sp. I65]